jgi:tripartite-type tricarboxylate transporter receptor subunit TctC
LKVVGRHDGMVVKKGGTMFRFVAGMLALIFVVGGAFAQGPVDWPVRPLRLVVPFAAGSGSDVIARLVAQRLGERLGQQVIVDNRVGGSSIIGTTAVANAARDGYTLGLANTTSHAAAPALVATNSFDPVKDFAPVSMIGSAPFVLLASTKGPIKSMRDLIALAKAKPTMLSYGSAGPGTLSHLAGALFERMAGVKMTHVPYRGTEQSMFDLIEGRIDVLFGTIAPTLSHIREGNLRALAITGERRNETLPDVVTLAEKELPGYEAALWTAIVLPAGVAPGIVARLNREIVAVVSSPEMQEALKKQGVEPQTGTPDALADRIRGDVRKWHDIILKAGLREK